ncbi:hypothetical protein HOH87_04475 [bacterium]|jgi:hypothetical protein|nr:hypothetical protein [bacterium]
MITSIFRAAAVGGLLITASADKNDGKNPKLVVSQVTRPDSDSSVIRDVKFDRYGNTRPVFDRSEVVSETVDTRPQLFGETHFSESFLRKIFSKTTTPESQDSVPVTPKILPSVQTDEVPDIAQRRLYDASILSGPRFGSNRATEAQLRRSEACDKNIQDRRDGINQEPWRP